VKSEKKKQGVLNRAVIRKEAIKAKKAIKKAKPSPIVILKVRSSILPNISA
jgi:hypothetical protein